MLPMSGCISTGRLANYAESSQHGPPYAESLSSRFSARNYPGQKGRGKNLGGVSFLFFPLFPLPRARRTRREKKN